MASWIPTYESVPNSLPQQTLDHNFSSIEELFSIKDDPNIHNLIKIKESVLDIMQSKTEIEYEEILDYKDEEIDNFIEKTKEILKIFKEKQDDIDIINENYKKEIRKIRDHLKIIDAQIDFIKKLPKDYKNEDSIQEIISKMNDYTKHIQNNENVEKLKKDYLTKIKEIHKYIYLIRKINNFNTCNMCPVCFENPVDHFIAPCGHTYCKSCLERLIPSDNIYELDYNSQFKCSFCRENVKTVRPLYFL
tara:strand:- start:413 stop:1156 length:744 start_codon:yes stop_codon:yes gene_type:complete